MLANTPHAERAHAKLSPSAASRWIACPPSVAFTLDMPDEGSTSAQEGSIAHEVAEAVLRLRWAGNLTYPDIAGATMEMLEYAEDYASYVMQASHSMEVELGIERRVDVSLYVPDSFGTVDCYLYCPRQKELHIIDYKYGRGVRVSAVENAQMRIYALGLIDELQMLGGDIKRVTTTIYQPRIGNISSEELEVEELIRWGEEVLAPAAELADKGEGEFRAGAHCVFCRGKATCRALADEMISLSAMVDIEANMLSLDEIGEALTKVELLSVYVKALKEHALASALAGKTPRGYKLVEGRSVRRYISEEAVANRLKEEAIPEDLIYERSIVGITACEKLLGKKRFAEVLGGLVEKPAGKPTLVALDDKRPAISNIADFADVSISDDSSN